MDAEIEEIIQRWRELVEEDDLGLPSFYRIVERDSIVKLLAWIDQQAELVNG